MTAKEQQAQEKAEAIRAASWKEVGDHEAATRFAGSPEGSDLRWVPAWKSWVEWQGDRWQVVPIEVAQNRIRSFLVRSVAEFAAVRPAPDTKDLNRLTSYLNKKERVSGAETFARGDLLTDPSEFDADPLLLNCRNGTLDLTTLRLREHRREDMLTQQTNCDFDPKAKSEDWERVLRDALPHPVVFYVQRILGYALTGLTNEEKFFEFYGVSGAGKSTILEAFANMLGSYARTVSAATLSKPAFKRSGSEATPDIARLLGARFVNTSEFDRGDALAEGLIKALTGRNKITARLLHKSEFEFFPQCKIFLDSNFRQRLSGSPESGIERRLVVVEFKNRIATPDDGLKSRLLSDEEAKAGILAWAVAGLRKWNKTGLGEAPAAIKEANKAYLKESDIYGHFAEECLDLIDGKETLVDDLYQAYIDWAQSNGHKVGAKTTLTKELTQRGFGEPRQTSREGRSVRLWSGVALDRQWKPLRVRKASR